MNKTEIHKIIGEKNGNNVPLTEEEMKIALQYFTENEIKSITFRKILCSKNIRKQK